MDNDGGDFGHDVAKMGLIAVYILKHLQKGIKDWPNMSIRLINDFKNVTCHLSIIIIQISDKRKISIFFSSRIVIEVRFESPGQLKGKQTFMEESETMVALP